MNKKKYFILVMLVIAILLNACSKSNNESFENKAENKDYEQIRFNYADNLVLKKPVEVIAEQGKGPLPSNTPSSKEQDKKLLDGIIICIDPGHQKKANLKTEKLAPNSNILKVKTASGTSGIATKVPEYVLNLEISLLLKDELEKNGAQIIMTREINDVNISNIERAEIANSAKANLTIRIHADGSNNKKAKGISVLIPGDKYIKNKMLIFESKKAGKIVLDSLIKSTSARSIGLITRNDLTGFNWSKFPVLLVEMGFMTNSNEDKELNSDKYRKKIVSGIVNGVKEYFGAI